MKKILTMLILVLIVSAPCFAFTIFYDDQTGAIYDCVYDRDVFLYDVTDYYSDVVMSTIEIDEVNPDNKALCRDIYRYGHIEIVDSNGNGKYYISGNPAELYERDGWTQYIEIPEVQ